MVNLYKNNIDIYKIKFHTCFDEASLKKMVKVLKLDCEVDADRIGGCMLQNKFDMGIFINVSDLKESQICGVIAHESYHLANHIMIELGIEYGYNSHNEHVAYLIEYISKKVFENLEKYRK